MVQRPTAVTVFAYQVGFGDCLLVRFTYPTRTRHVLIDFGTMELPADARSTHMRDVAADIGTKSGGRLDAVVATHRHADHISGFKTNAGGTDTGDVIAALKPKLVVQPWTEHPDLATNATGLGFAGPRDRVRAFGRSLAAMHEVADEASRLGSSEAGKALSADTRRLLRFIGEDNIKNLSAVKNLMAMGKAKGAKAEYLHYGAKTRLSTLLPGVKVHVLGPPTIRQHDSVRSQARTDPDEYWHLQRLTLHATAQGTSLSTSAFAGAAAERGNRLPAHARWVANRVRAANEEQLLGIVRILDRAMNNTSLILVFETGGKKLLFPGDAQGENWEYALSQPAARALLKDVSLYKVGHHGSLNATPKTMWNLLDHRGAATKQGRLKSVLSTLSGKHGHEEDDTEVPRRTLLEELRHKSELYNTEGSAALCEEVKVL
jgi:L-ascorbate metabolism protein UlaG (beta-lactamase superfamily)